MTASKQPQPQQYIRPEVMAFARAMEDTLRKHDGKKTYWRDVSVSFGYLFGRLSDEVREAKGEYDLRHPDYHKCVMELVDVANFCMMCYDRIHPADTRSHSSQPAPDISSCELGDCEGCTQQPVFTCENNVQQRIKAEREQMLGKIFEYMSSHGVEKRPEGYYVVSGTFSLGGFVKYLESLRQQEEQR